uniref:Uncharacterized protein n=1 Tax=Arundo donax TaxID=35708 RepID=A0A0A8ZEU1_ARUDO
MAKGNQCIWLLVSRCSDYLCVTVGMFVLFLFYFSQHFITKEHYSNAQQHTDKESQSHERETSDQAVEQQPKLDVGETGLSMKPRSREKLQKGGIAEHIADGCLMRTMLNHQQLNEIMIVVTITLLVASGRLEESQEMVQIKNFKGFHVHRRDTAAGGYKQSIFTGAQENLD